MRSRRRLHCYGASAASLADGRPTTVFVLVVETCRISTLQFLAIGYMWEFIT